METGASFFVFWSDTPRLEIRSHGFLLEVVHANRNMVHFRRRITRPQDEKVFPEHELVVPVPFVYSATEYFLVKIGRLLQIADEQRDVIDTVALEAGSFRDSGTGRQNR